MAATITGHVCKVHRSMVPDLLFEDIQSARIQEVAPYLETPEHVDSAVPLHRLTVFLTYACNLACPYCKTIARSSKDLQAFPQKAHKFTLETFQNLLQSQGETPIRHLHFTGGEATLLPDLPRMVEYARSVGVSHVSVTSNGTLPPERYYDLVRNGIDEIRISIDARTMEMGAALTGRKNAWSSSVRTLCFLGELRREYPRLFLIANTVISRANRADMAEMVRFLLSLSVDDIKLITVVQEKEDLGDFECAGDVVKEIEEILARYPAEAMPLLRRKIKTVFDSDSIGLAEVPDAQRSDWRCYIPLTERTVDSDFYYPCSVYLREGGRPLGRLADSPETQRAKSAHFVRTGNCLEDPICAAYCLHCTRAYNVGANEARKNGIAPTE